MTRWQSIINWKILQEGAIPSFDCEDLGKTRKTLGTVGVPAEFRTGYPQYKSQKH
jgi:hypothetical protein